MGLLDDKDIMQKVYEEFPRESQYPLEYFDGKHNCWNNSSVIYCNSDRDIRRCNLCGHEWECACDF